MKRIQLFTKRALTIPFIACALPSSLSSSDEVPKPLPGEWSKHVDPETKCCYWVNKSTKETKWDAWNYNPPSVDGSLYVK